MWLQHRRPHQRQRLRKWNRPQPSLPNNPKSPKQREWRLSKDNPLRLKRLNEYGQIAKRVNCFIDIINVRIEFEWVLDENFQELVDWDELELVFDLE